VKVCTQSLGKLLDNAKQGAIGEIMFDQAKMNIASVISDLDAAVIFAAAGQLEMEGVTNISNTQQELVATAKRLATASAQLVDSTKVFNVSTQIFIRILRELKKILAKQQRISHWQCHNCLLTQSRMDHCWEICEHSRKYWWPRRRYPSHPNN
jgi:rRNA maturation endonuclease Nob1